VVMINASDKAGDVISMPCRALQGWKNNDTGTVDNNNTVYS